MTFDQHKSVCEQCRKPGIPCGIGLELIRIETITFGPSSVELTSPQANGVHQKGHLPTLDDYDRRNR